jgi:biotin-(acetyl-CoA carboxylase) ligase
MSASASARTASLRRDPQMPPGFACVTLREGGDAFAHAVAQAGALGAATITWVRRFDLVEFAVVLEPDEPLATARLAHYAGMNALADTLAAHVPPERALVFGWPDAVLIDGGLVGGGRTAWPSDAREDEPPPWLVFGAMIRLSSRLDFDSGARAVGVGAGVALDEMGGDDITATDLVESFARHLMRNVHDWTTQGPKAVAKRWLERLQPEVGVRHGVDPAGDLIIRSQAGETKMSLIEALARADWYDAEGREPKL